MLKGKLTLFNLKRCVTFIALTRTNLSR